MSIHYKVTFYDLLPGFTDGTGYIDEPVITVAAKPAYPPTSYNDLDSFARLGDIFLVSFNGKPMVAHVVITSEDDGHFGSPIRIQRNYFIGDPCSAVAVRFTSTTTGAVSKACSLHSYDDDQQFYDLGQGGL